MTGKMVDQKIAKPHDEEESSATTDRHHERSLEESIKDPQRPIPASPTEHHGQHARRIDELGD